MTERIRQHAQRAKRGVDRVQIFDLVIEIAFDGRIEFPGPRSLNQDFQKESEEIEIFFRRRERKRVDLEIVGFQTDTDVRTAEELREAFKTPAQIEDEGVRVVFLQVGNEEVQKETFSRARSPENHGVRHIAVMEI